MKKKLLWVLAAVGVALLIPVLWIAHALSDLPDVTVLKRYRPAVASEAMDRNGLPLAQFYDRAYRIWEPVSALPDRVIESVVIAEDDTFFGHQGINYKAVWDAFRHDMARKRFARGGSTITQQMIKNVLLSKEKTITRKVREFVLARQAEEILTKRRILEIYLNEVEWGDGIYGIEAASRYYFDKHAAELTDGEAALLAGMLPNPHYYDPFKRPDKAIHRRDQVLFNMQQARLLTPEAYASALNEPLRLRDAASTRFDFSESSGAAARPCHLQVLEDVLLRFFGETKLYRKGLRIRTTLDRSLQNSIASLASSVTPTTAERPDRVVVVKDGKEIIALSCSAGEEEVWNFLGLPVIGGPLYDVETVRTEQIAKDDILLPKLEEDQGAKTDKAPSDGR